ncbi:MAG: hypothetical protein H0T46_27090 [Deltaproteobacteria bacterium]|nr:hypothetical protein [Deltaproteobacteria bacterium]
MRAALLLLPWLAACGDGLPAPSDAGGDDGPTTGLVRVQYWPQPNNLPGNAAAGRPVIFLNPDDSIALVTRTRDDGTANAFVPAGSSVTVVASDGSLWSYLDIQPGDELTIGPPPVPVEQVMVTLRAPAAPDGSTYWLYTTCDRGFPSFVTGIETPFGLRTALTVCDGGLTDLLLVSRKQFIDTPDKFIFLPGQRLSEGASITFSEPYLRAETGVIATSVPISIGFLEVRQLLVGRDLMLDTQGIGNTVMFASNGMASMLTPVPVHPDATLVTQLDDLGTGRRTGLHHVISWGPATTLTLVDFGELIDSLVRPPALDVAKREVNWFHGRDGVIPESAIVTLFVDGVPWTLASAFHSDGDGNAWLHLPVLPGAFGRALPGEFQTEVDAVTLHGTSSMRTRLLSWTPGGPWPIGAERTGRVLFQTTNHNVL